MVGKFWCHRCLFNGRYSVKLIYELWANSQLHLSCGHPLCRASCVSCCNIQWPNLLRMDTKIYESNDIYHYTNLRFKVWAKHTIILHPFWKFCLHVLANGSHSTGEGCFDIVLPVTPSLSQGRKHFDCLIISFQSLKTKNEVICCRLLWHFLSNRSIVIKRSI